MIHTQPCVVIERKSPVNKTRMFSMNEIEGQTMKLHTHESAENIQCDQSFYAEETAGENEK